MNLQSQIKEYYEKFLFWWKNDSKAKLKLIFISAIIIFLLLIILLISYFNSDAFINGSNLTTDINNSQVTIDNQTSQSNIELFKSNKLTKLQTPPVGSTVGMKIEKDENFYINNNYKIVFNNEEVSYANKIIAKTIFEDGNNFIINQDDKTLIFNKQSKSIISVDPGINFLTPFNNGYFYLSKNQNNYIIRKLRDYNTINTAETVGVIRPNRSSQFAEIRIINNQMYFFVWENINRTGNLSIWGGEQGSYKNIQSLNYITSFKFGNNIVFYNLKVNQEKNEYGIVEFDKDQAKVNTLDLKSELNKLQVYGEFWASRCNESLKDEFNCLIKKQSVPFNLNNQPDEIVNYNYKQKVAKLNYPGVPLSGISLYYSNKELQLYLIDQIDLNLYVLK
jgi:hypothetical protein